MDEYELEIRSQERVLAGLRAREAEPAVIDECEAELRILRELHRAAWRTFEAGERDRRLAPALADLGYGEWTMVNVYSFVYEVAVDAAHGDADLAASIAAGDYAARLLEMGSSPGR